MNLYISDLHFGHTNMIRYDHRPFADAEEMDNVLIELWNSRVSENDRVYIIGDFAFTSGKNPEWYLDQLKGQKYLITGNHDGIILKNKKVREYFKEIRQIMKIRDNDKQIVLCHYPLAEWEGYFYNVWHIYGHIHRNTNDAYYFMKTQERALNAAACINNYTPCSFNELLANNRRFLQEMDSSGSTQTSRVPQVTLNDRIESLSSEYESYHTDSDYWKGIKYALDALGRQERE